MYKIEVALTDEQLNILKNGGEIKMAWMNSGYCNELTFKFDKNVLNKIYEENKNK